MFILNVEGCCFPHMTRMQSGPLLLLAQWFEVWGLRSLILARPGASWSRDGSYNASRHVGVQAEEWTKGNMAYLPQIKFFEELPQILAFYFTYWSSVLEAGGKAFRGACFCYNNIGVLLFQKKGRMDLQGHWLSLPQP